MAHRRIYVSRLKNSLQAERNAHKETKQRFGWVGELTPDEVQELRDAREDLQYQLENTKAPSTEELEERAEKLAARKARQLEQQLNGTMEELASYKQAITLHEAAANQRRIRDAVEEALSGEKAVPIHSSAREDILPYAERIMEITEDGEVRSKDGVGVDPGLTFAEVLSDLQTSGRRSHWFKGNQGAGMKGGDGSSVHSGPNPFAKDSFNLTEVGRLVKSDPRRALQLCKAAGENPKKFGIREAAA